MKRNGINGLIWDAQPKWAKVIQATVAFPAIFVAAYTMVFDPDDPKGRFLYCVGSFVLLAVMQLFFFIMSSTGADYRR